MSTAVLLLDCGNSAVKWRLLVDGRLQDQGRSALDALLDELPYDARDLQVLVSSVAAPEREQALEKRLTLRQCRVWFARSTACCDGLSNGYAEPERLGVDRWLAMLGARQRCTGAFCVVDAGSALTIDLVGAGGDHRGGYILPGLRLMEQALLSNTDRVRFDALQAATLAPGRATADAVGRGSLLAHCGAIDRALQQFTGADATPTLFLCGGDAETLHAHLSRPAIMAPELVFAGLLVQARAEGVADVPAIERSPFA